MRFCFHSQNVALIALVLVTLFLKDIGIHFPGPGGHFYEATWYLMAMTQGQRLLWTDFPFDGFVVGVEIYGSDSHGMCGAAVESGNAVSFIHREGGAHE